MLMKLRKMVRNQKGFTLIELLVVISIIGVLAAIGVPKFMDTTATARVAKVQAELGAIDSAIQIYGANNAGNLSKTVADVEKYLSGEKMPVGTTGKYKLEKTKDAVTYTPVYGINDKFQAIVTLDVEYTAATLNAKLEALK